MANNNIKITKEDIERLGYPVSELKRFERALVDVELVIVDNDIIMRYNREKCDAKRAIEVLGREDFISGLCRAADHNDSSRYSSDGRYTIEFDLTKWWLESKKNQG